MIGLGFNVFAWIVFDFGCDFCDSGEDLVDLPCILLIFVVILAIWYGIQ